MSEISYSVGELRRVIRESSQKNEFKPKLGPNVERDVLTLYLSWLLFFLNIVVLSTTSGAVNNSFATASTFCQEVIRKE